MLALWFPLFLFHFIFVERMCLCLKYTYIGIERACRRAIDHRTPRRLIGWSLTRAPARSFLPSFHLPVPCDSCPQSSRSSIDGPSGQISFRRGTTPKKPNREWKTTRDIVTVEPTLRNSDAQNVPLNLISKLGTDRGDNK